MTWPFRSSIDDIISITEVYDLVTYLSGDHGLLLQRPGAAGFHLHACDTNEGETNVR